MISSSTHSGLKYPPGAATATTQPATATSHGPFDAEIQTPSNQITALISQGKFEEAASVLIYNGCRAAIMSNPPNSTDFENNDYILTKSKDTTLYVLDRGNVIKLDLNDNQNLVTQLRECNDDNSLKALILSEKSYFTLKAPLTLNNRHTLDNKTQAGFAKQVFPNLISQSKFKEAALVLIYNGINLDYETQARFAKEVFPNLISQSKFEEAASIVIKYEHATPADFAKQVVIGLISQSKFKAAATVVLLNTTLDNETRADLVKEVLPGLISQNEFGSAAALLHNFGSRLAPDVKARFETQIPKAVMKTYKF